MVTPLTASRTGWRDGSGPAGRVDDAGLLACGRAGEGLAPGRAIPAGRARPGPGREMAWPPARGVAEAVVAARMCVRGGGRGRAQKKARERVEPVREREGIGRRPLFCFRLTPVFWRARACAIRVSCLASAAGEREAHPRTHPRPRHRPRTHALATRGEIVRELKRGRAQNPAGPCAPARSPVLALSLSLRRRRAHTAYLVPTQAQGLTRS